jgi:hypothetical protein
MMGAWSETCSTAVGTLASAQRARNELPTYQGVRLRLSGVVSDDDGTLRQKGTDVLGLSIQDIFDHIVDGARGVLVSCASRPGPSARSRLERAASCTPATQPSVALPGVLDPPPTGGGCPRCRAQRGHLVPPKRASGTGGSARIVISTRARSGSGSTRTPNRDDPASCRSPRTRPARHQVLAEAIQRSRIRLDRIPLMAAACTVRRPASVCLPTSSKGSKGFRRAAKCRPEANRIVVGRVQRQPCQARHRPPLSRAKLERAWSCQTRPAR